MFIADEAMVIVIRKGTGDSFFGGIDLACNGAPMVCCSKYSPVNVRVHEESLAATRLKAPKG